MPDLQTALSKVIHDWETPAAAPAAPTEKARPYFSITTNVCRSTFDHIKQHPGLPRPELIRQLADKGFKVTSTTSLLTQMLRQGMIKLHGNGLFVAQAEYTPIKARLARPPKKPIAAVRAAPAVEKRKAVRARPSPPAQPVQLAQPVQPVQPERPTVAGLLNTLSIADARQLYDELRKIFGA